MGMGEHFETFAKKLCEFCMKNYVIPYLHNHGYIMSYRAKVVSKNTSNQTMQIQKPFDNTITLPYSDSASSLAAGNECVVLSLGDSSNSMVFSDGMLNDTAYNVLYATSSSGATASAKVASTENGNFVLATGAMVRVKFTNGNTYNGTATLNVDGTGAVNIARVGTTTTTRYYWTAGEVVDFVYDGTNFVMSAKGTASTTYYGLVKLTTTATSASTSLVPTASCVDAKIALKVPDAPSAAGNYILTCSVDSGGNATYSWS